MRTAIGTGLFLMLAACGGGAAQPPPATPAGTTATQTPTPETPAKSTAWALPDGPRDKDIPPKPAVTTVKLDVWKTATDKLKGIPGPPATCADWVKKGKAAKTDAELLAVADPAPPECTDAIVDPALAKHGDATDENGHRLIAYSLAGRLARTSLNMPKLAGAPTKVNVLKHVNGPLKTWWVEQTAAIDQLSAAGLKLVPAGRAVVAVEAGMADLRLVDTSRTAPVPAEWEKDAELKQAYEQALDQQLEPRKKRGRDASLVGLVDYANLNTPGTEPRVDRDRTLLSKMYGGRRINALDKLIVASGNARLEQGRIYWRRVDFVEAAYAVSDKKDDDSRLQLAVALALAKGPNGPQEMMTAPSPSALGLDHTEALDALAAEGGKNAGAAMYDSAYLRSLMVPDDATASAYLADISARAKKASALMTDADQKKKADQLAADSDAASKATK